MIARLQVFYGGSPMDWLRMPMCVMRSYMKCIPRLRAEASLSKVSEVMLGTGSMEKKHAERAIRDLQREAAGPRKPRKPISEQERIEMLKETGWFDVEIVE